MAFVAIKTGKRHDICTGDKLRKPTAEMIGALLSQDRASAVQSRVDAQSEAV